MIIVSGNLILFIIWCSFLRIFFLTLVSSSLSLLFYFILKVEQKCILKWLWCYLICCLLLCSMHNKRNKIIVFDCFFIRRPTMKKLLLRTLNGVVKSQGSYLKKKTRSLDGWWWGQKTYPHICFTITLYWSWRLTGSLWILKYKIGDN